jgi:hypothetical protein
LAKENLTKEELNKLLIAADSKGRTVNLEAAKFCREELF